MAKLAEPPHPIGTVRSYGPAEDPSRTTLETPRLSCHFTAAGTVRLILEFGSRSQWIDVGAADAFCLAVLLHGMPFETEGGA